MQRFHPLLEQRNRKHNYEALPVVIRYIKVLKFVRNASVFFRNLNFDDYCISLTL